MANAWRCPVCGEGAERAGEHLKEVHGERAWEEAVVAAKDAGTGDAEIGRLFGISFGRLTALLMDRRKSGSFGGRRPRPIRRLQPDEEQQAAGTVWSFRGRGSWAVHDGSYRGNWSPYIPRNIMHHYSRKGDMVLDTFVGGGTTAVEALLLGRNFRGFDVNSGAVSITLESIARLKRHAASIGKELRAATAVGKGDARKLRAVGDSSVDLICTHPPYAGIVKYSEGAEGDLSALEAADYLDAMQEVAMEHRRVLRPGGRCVLLLGDKRKEKRVVPLGFMTMERYASSGFDIDRLIIKRQFNTRTTGLWYRKAMQGNFLLLGHEYLPVFRRGRALERMLRIKVEAERFDFMVERCRDVKPGAGRDASTVWAADEAAIPSDIARISSSDCMHRLAEGKPGGRVKGGGPILIDSTGWNALGPQGVRGRVAYASGLIADAADSSQVLAVRVRDIGTGRRFVPMGMLLWSDMRHSTGWRMREIVIIDESALPGAGAEDGITHSYILIYEKV